MAKALRGRGTDQNAARRRTIRAGGARLLRHSCCDTFHRNASWRILATGSGRRSERCSEKMRYKRATAVKNLRSVPYTQKSPDRISAYHKNITPLNRHRAFTCVWNAYACSRISVCARPSSPQTPANTRQPNRTVCGSSGLTLPLVLVFYGTFYSAYSSVSSERTIRFRPAALRAGARARQDPLAPAREH